MAAPAPIVHHETVVVHDDPPPARRVRRTRSTSYRRDVGLLLRLGSFSYSDPQDGAGNDDLNMGSLGAAMRFNLDQHWGIEIAAEYAMGEDEIRGVKRETIPLTGSLVLNMFPDSFLNLYGVLGAGAYFTEVRIPDRGYSETYRRMGAHLGGGAELRLSPALRLFSDLRFVALSNPSDEDASSDSGALPPTTLSLEEGDAAVQFQAGLAIYF